MPSSVGDQLRFFHAGLDVVRTCMDSACPFVFENALREYSTRVPPTKEIARLCETFCSFAQGFLHGLPSNQSQNQKALSQHNTVDIQGTARYRKATLLLGSLGLLESGYSNMKPNQTKPSQTKPNQAKPSQAKPSQAKPEFAHKALNRYPQATLTRASRAEALLAHGCGLSGDGGAR